MATYKATDRNGVTTTMTLEEKRSAGPRWVKFERIDTPAAAKSVPQAPIKGFTAPAKKADDDKE